MTTDKFCLHSKNVKIMTNLNNRDNKENSSPCLCAFLQDHCRTSSVGLSLALNRNCFRQAIILSLIFLPRQKIALVEESYEAY